MGLNDYIDIGIGDHSTADGEALNDPEVLKKLTTSVSSALDEAAAALNRMKPEHKKVIITYHFLINIKNK